MDKLLETQGTVKKKKKDKQFHMPWHFTFSQGKVRKKDYAIVQRIKTNGAVKFEMKQIEDNTIKLAEDQYHDASASHILRYKKYPMIIIPEWNMKPFSPAENMETAAEQGTLASSEKVILAKMKAEQIKPKMKINILMIVIIIAIALGALWALSYFGIIQ